MENDEIDIVKLQAALLQVQRFDPTPNPHPLDERIEVVKSCQESCKSALASLDQLQRKFLDTLDSIREKRVNLKKTMSDANSRKINNSESHVQPHIPFFIDVNYQKPPDNQDTLAIRGLGVPDFCFIRPAKQWTAENKNLLVSSVYKQAMKIHLHSARSKMYEVRRNKSSTKIEMIEAVKALNQAKNINPESIIEPLKCKDPYDWELVSLDCNEKYTAAECRSMWHLLLHPHINKSAWTAGEVNKLRLVVSHYEECDWENIAESLGTGRSPYQCFVYYKMFICRNKTSGKKWTPAEDKLLRDAIEHCRVGENIPWTKVAYFMKNRSKRQIYNRWLQNNYILEVGSFTPEEDAVLIPAIVVYGNQFDRIVKLLPGRRKHHISKRYEELFCPPVYPNNSYWSNENDAVLLQAAKDNDSSFNLKTIRNKIPEKSFNDIKRRYKLLLKYLKEKNIRNEFLKKLKPKNEALIDLQKALKKIKPQNKNKKHKIKENKGKELKIDSVDKRIIRYFEETITPQTQTKSSEAQIDIVKLKSILYLLGANLDIDLLQSNEYINSNEDLKKALETLLTNQTRTTVKPTGIRTYSRKKPKEVSTSSTEGSISNMGIWSHESSKNKDLQTYFPPMLDTLAATRTLSLLKHHQSFYLSKQNRINYFDRPMLNEHFNLWISRFHTIFKWPLILSTVQPNRQLLTAIIEEKKLVEFNEIDLCANGLFSKSDSNEIRSLQVTCFSKNDINKKNNVEPIENLLKQIENVESSAHKVKNCNNVKNNKRKLNSSQSEPNKKPNTNK